MRDHAAMQPCGRGRVLVAFCVEFLAAGLRNFMRRVLV
jgi:hypothetical protein